jgi:hypothetical protein
MAVNELIASGRNTQDNLGARDTVQDFVPKRNKETIYIEENATKITTQTLGHSMVLGHSVNGKLGVVNLGVDGQQVVLGEANQVTTLVAVTSPNNTFREHFRDTTFQDGSAPNTANWDTTLFRLAMHTSGNHATIYNTIATSAEIALNDGTIVQATLTSTETKFGNDTIRYFLSADGGSNWEEVTAGTLHTFTNQGTDLRCRILMLGSGGKDTYITFLRVEYT